MKLLESGRLEALSRALSILNGDSVVQGRVESYSCKMAGTEKAFYKRFTADGETTHDLQALSPPEGVMYRCVHLLLMMMTDLSCFSVKQNIFLISAVACQEMKMVCCVTPYPGKLYST